MIIKLCHMLLSTSVMLLACVGLLLVCIVRATCSFSMYVAMRFYAMIANPTLTGIIEYVSPHSS